MKVTLSSKMDFVHKVGIEIMLDFKYEQDWTILRYLTISLKNLKNEQFSDAKKAFDTMRSEKKINCNLKFRLFFILEN